MKLYELLYCITSSDNIKVAAYDGKRIKNIYSGTNKDTLNSQWRELIRKSEYNVIQVNNVNNKICILAQKGD